MASAKVKSTVRHSPNLLSFELLPSSHNTDGRLGRLHFQSRTVMDTPHYVASSSRGAVPHISQDMMRTNTSTKGLYAALEDFVERASHQSQTPPVYNTPARPYESPLRKFISLQKDALLILGPRRVPPVPCAASNTNSAISIVTSLGSGMLEYTDYAEALQRLRPDIVVGMGDVLFYRKPGVKRADKMGDRTLAWMKALIAAMRDHENGTPNTALFAPILPIEPELQSFFTDALGDELLENISGLALYDTASIDAVPQNLEHLPRLYLGEVKSPHELLNVVALGADILTVSFITEATNAGIALDFSFPLKEPGVNSSSQLGRDMWSPINATSLEPLTSGCECYTCKNHHCAFLQHLLNAKEMLGWVLLQLHNHHIIDEFFAGVRQSLSRGLFDDDRRTFTKYYAAELPERTGQGPRVRGYQIKSKGRGEPRKNPPAYRSLDERKEKLADANLLPSPSADALDLEEMGFAEMMA